MGLGDSPQARLEAQLEGLTHAIERKALINPSNKILASKSTVLTLGKKATETDNHCTVLGIFITPGNWKQFQKIGRENFTERNINKTGITANLDSYFKFINFKSLQDSIVSKWLGCRLAVQTGNFLKLTSFFIRECIKTQTEFGFLQNTNLITTIY